MSTRWRNPSVAVLVALPVLGSLALAMSFPGEARADYVGNKYTDAVTGEVLEYNIFVPTGYDPAKKYPLMVVLHAANTNQIPPPRTLSSDGKGWATTFINTPHQATDPAFFMIPISQTNDSGWGDPTTAISTDEKFEGRLTVTVLKRDVMTRYSIDAARLYITGPSMGGRGTWDIIRRYPGMFAAAAPAAAPASVADAPIYVNQNIWAICGEVDPIVQGERDAIVAIRKLGGNPIYTELAGHGHDSWRTVYPDPQFVPWIFAQRLGVPWWTVSKAPTAVANATLTTGWPATMPPATLPTSFGGATGTAGGPSGAGGGSGVAGTSGSGAAGRSGGGPTATGGASGTGATAGGGPGTGGSSPPPITGTTSSGGTSVAGAGTGGAPAATPSTSGGAKGASASADPGGGGCTYVASAPAHARPLAAGALVVGLVALRRRRRPKPRR